MLVVLVFVLMTPLFIFLIFWMLVVLFTMLVFVFLLLFPFQRRWTYFNRDFGFVILFCLRIAAKVYKNAHKKIRKKKTRKQYTVHILCSKKLTCLMNRLHYFRLHHVYFLHSRQLAQSPPWWISRTDGHVTNNDVTNSYPVCFMQRTWRALGVPRSENSPRSSLFFARRIVIAGSPLVSLFLIDFREVLRTISDSGAPVLASCAFATSKLARAFGARPGALRARFIRYIWVFLGFLPFWVFFIVPIYRVITKNISELTCGKSTFLTDWNTKLRRLQRTRTSTTTLNIEQLFTKVEVNT